MPTCRRALSGCGPQARWLCCSLLTYHLGYSSSLASRQRAWGPAAKCQVILAQALSGRGSRAAQCESDYAGDRLPEFIRHSQMDYYRALSERSDLLSIISKSSRALMPHIGGCSRRDPDLCSGYLMLLFVAAKYYNHGRCLRSDVIKFKVNSVGALWVSSMRRPTL